MKTEWQDSFPFLAQVLDTIEPMIAVINTAGEIVYVNQSWIRFAHNNACRIETSWVGINYLEECRKAADRGDGFAQEAEQGLVSVISGESSVFEMEYPCHSPDTPRWFRLRVAPLEGSREPFFVITHHNITTRKLIELEMQRLAHQDGLTGLANRRMLNEFLASEWKRCMRLKQPISLAMIDLDYFKQLNDHHGHLYGDECLRAVASCLKDFARRPGDLAARYGGEEFVLVLGNTGLEAAAERVEQFRLAVQALGLSHDHSPQENILTISAGVACTIPQPGQEEITLINKADALLYDAKHAGRNQVITGEF